MPALSAADFAAAIHGGAVPMDLRSPAAFAAGHVPGSLFLQFGRQDLGERAEMFVPRDSTYVLVMEPAALGPVAEKLLTDAGYQVAGHLAGGLRTWTAAGHPLASLPTVTVQELQARLAAGERPDLLDVRMDFEFDWGHVEGAVNVPHMELWERAGELDARRHWLIICNDQVRSGAAASMLRRLGFGSLTLVLGGTAAWAEAGYPLAKKAG